MNKTNDQIKQERLELVQVIIGGVLLLITIMGLYTLLFIFTRGITGKLYIN